MFSVHGPHWACFHRERKREREKKKKWVKMARRWRRCLFAWTRKRYKPWNGRCYDVWARVRWRSYMYENRLDFYENGIIFEYLRRHSGNSKQQTISRSFGRVVGQIAANGQSHHSLWAGRRPHHCDFFSLLHFFIIVICVFFCFFWIVFVEATTNGSLPHTGRGTCAHRPFTISYHFCAMFLICFIFQRN